MENEELWEAVRTVTRNVLLSGREAVPMAFFWNPDTETMIPAMLNLDKDHWADVIAQMKAESGAKEVALQAPAWKGSPIPKDVKVEDAVRPKDDALRQSIIIFVIEREDGSLDSWELPYDIVGSTEEAGEGRVTYTGEWKSIGEPMESRFFPGKG